MVKARMPTNTTRRCTSTWGAIDTKRQCEVGLLESGVQLRQSTIVKVLELLRARIASQGTTTTNRQSVNPQWQPGYVCVRKAKTRSADARVQAA